MTITVSTDGSALGNPNGPMGWAWADHSDGDRDSHQHAGDCDAGGATNGTNQIGELCAVLEALRAHPGDEPLIIETDSQYAINCSTKWVHGWKKNGWRNSKKEPVKNAAVIKAIDAEIAKRPASVKFVWVKGHAGNAGNEKVDTLARTYAEDARSHVRDGYLPREGWQSLLDSPYAKGTDVPQDAQMLLDGDLSEADYTAQRCMGSDSASDSTVDTNDAATATSFDQQSSLEELTENDATQAEQLTDEIHETNAAAENAAETQDHDQEAAEETAAETEHTTESAETAESENTAESAGERESGTESKPENGTAESVKQTVKQPVLRKVHTASTLRKTGITISGTVRMSPPPNTSPTFDGSPRPVHGWVRVEGYVQGDGTLELTNEPFLIER
ncbi:ribonuclease H [Bifidobacterium dolichotidis]|uniref:ribonuclease H n=1 Tax=Bifidobacterium dolichotidis TaxID=2306976 RepID=A0A430FQ20_9BIFI|nr:ribonuclease H [Bifidobacterium dolichotidis]RSX54939.1 ribonuclease H [Bifidobacterium dolichotidis]